MAKAADVCLVLDISGTITGSKLAAACEAIRRFCDRPQSTATAVRLVSVEDRCGCRPRPANRPGHTSHRIGDPVRECGRCDGSATTVAVAVAELERAASPGHLRAVLLLTDGEENSSQTTFSEAQTALDDAGVTVFAIAYGADADEATLRLLVGAHVIRLCRESCDGGYAGCKMTRLRSRAKLARPYIWRLIVLILFTVPSTLPEL